TPKVTLSRTGVGAKPFVGSTVVTVYDKSVEYIAGGSNVPEIREFFWKWRTTHQPQCHSSLDSTFSNLLKQGETPMNGVGTFGDLVDIDDEGESVARAGRG